MTRIKICGVSRPCDVDYVNEAKPDFCGFIIGVPGSRRNVSPETVRELRKKLDQDVLPIGVFVDAPQSLIAELVQDGTISLVQLHGHENAEYIRSLREQINTPVIQAFSVHTPEDVRRAEESEADLILLDHGSGGTGERFDWSLLKGISRPFILAGGLSPENLCEAIRSLRPWAVDLSSGVETEGKKDRSRILSAVRAARQTELEEMP